jgi:hypothetical protein
MLDSSVVLSGNVIPAMCFPYAVNVQRRMFVIVVTCLSCLCKPNI